MGRHKLRIAIIGGGISGLYTAHLLQKQHDFKLYEAANYVGGHSNTVEVEIQGDTVAVDTGFIVYNERNYPLFTALLDELGVATLATDMSFSVSCRQSGLEYCGTSLNTLFAQRRNIFRRSFQRMIFEILRFNKLSTKLLAAPASQSLQGFLKQHNFSGMVVDDYLIPMAAAIWSSNPSVILDFPAAYFGRFFDNHGLLTVNDQPQWRTILGGSKHYVNKLTAQFIERIQLNSPVTRVQRLGDQIRVITKDKSADTFDAVVFACHSDQALKMLEKPSTDEQRILGAIEFQSNDTVLHTDKRLMPDNQRAWAAWNYHRIAKQADQVCVTYDMTALQHLETPLPLLVTLNATEHIDAKQILGQFCYDHPLYTHASVAARGEWDKINGVNNSFFCGAYWGYGFHEDGMRSAAKVVAAINELSDAKQLHIQRVS